MVKANVPNMREARLNENEVRKVQGPGSSCKRIKTSVSKDGVELRSTNREGKVNRDALGVSFPEITNHSFKQNIFLSSLTKKRKSASFCIL